MTRSVSPCMRCVRVKDPRDCDNKNCKVWQAWFLERWALIHAYPRAKMDNARMEPVGACVSGTHYAAPNQVDRYLHTDPCDGCLCPRDLCKVPCRVRRAWLQAREDVFL